MSLCLVLRTCFKARVRTRRAYFFVPVIWVSTLAHVYRNAANQHSALTRFMTVTSMSNRHRLVSHDAVYYMFGVSIWAPMCPSPP